MLIRIVQRILFQTDIKNLMTEVVLNKKMKLQNLNIFLDKREMLRYLSSEFSYYNKNSI